MIPLYDDREDYREPRPIPFMTILIILANLAVFAGWQLKFGIEESVAQCGFLPQEFVSHPLSIWTWRWIFSAMFMHAGWMHLIGNMWFLWIFGEDIEEHLGASRYLFLYLLCGIASTLTFALVNPDGNIPLVGASGAISGVLGAYFLHRPGARITTFIFFPIPRVINLPSLIFLLYWIGLQVASQYMASRANDVKSGGVAYVAHIGGFIAGLILINCVGKKPDRRRSAYGNF